MRVGRVQGNEIMYGGTEVQENRSYEIIMDRGILLALPLGHVATDAAWPTATLHQLNNDHHEVVPEDHAQAKNMKRNASMHELVGPLKYDNQQLGTRDVPEGSQIAQQAIIMRLVQYQIHPSDYFENELAARARGGLQEGIA